MRYEKPEDVYAYSRARKYIGINVEDDAEPSFNEQKYRKDKITLFRELALYLEKGVDREEIRRDLLAHWSNTSSFHAIADAFLTDLVSNDPVFRAMAKRPNVFTETEVQLLQLGWEKGKEPEALSQIVRFLKRDDTISRKVKAASWYPGVLTIGMIVSFSIYNAVMLPQLRQLYINLNIAPVWPLPWLFAFYDFIGSPIHDVLLAALFAAFVVPVILWTRTEQGTLAVDNFRLNFPPLRSTGISEAPYQRTLHRPADGRCR